MLGVLDIYLTTAWLAVWNSHIGTGCAVQEHAKYKQAMRARKPEAKLRTILSACQGVSKDEVSGAPQPKYRCVSSTCCTTYKHVLGNLAHTELFGLQQCDTLRCFTQAEHHMQCRFCTSSK